MKFKSTGVQVVNRFGKRYEAIDDVFTSDSEESEALFMALGFTNLDTKNEIITDKESPKKKRNSKV